MHLSFYSLNILWHCMIYIYIHKGALIKSNSTASSSFQSQAHDIHLVERFANFLKKTQLSRQESTWINHATATLIHPMIYLENNMPYIMRLLCDISWQQPFCIAFVWRNPGLYRCFMSFCPWLGSQVSNVNKLILIFWILAVYFFIDWIHAYLGKSVWGLGNCRFLGTTGDGGCGWWTGVLRCLKW